MDTDSSHQAMQTYYEYLGADFFFFFVGKAERAPEARSQRSLGRPNFNYCGARTTPEGRSAPTDEGSMSFYAPTRSELAARPKCHASTSANNSLEIQRCRSAVAGKRNKQGKVEDVVVMLWCCGCGCLVAVVEVCGGVGCGGC